MSTTYPASPMTTTVEPATMTATVKPATTASTEAQTNCLKTVDIQTRPNWLGDEVEAAATTETIAMQHEIM